MTTNFIADSLFVHTQVERRIADATLFVQTTDRSDVEGFSVSTESLALLLALQRSKADWLQATRDQSDDARNYLQEQDIISSRFIARKMLDGGDYANDIVYCGSGELVMRGLISEEDWAIVDETKVWAERFTAVRDNQGYHPYFSRGIWDIPFVEDCISHDIDAELAVTLYSERT